MKILKLNLLAFGPFSGEVLDFDKGTASFHVVYGPNEAGKSSSLRALRQCLYGIPHNSTDNFIHPNPNLRIGGVLKDSQGKQLEFIRRKGRDKTLRGADDVQVIEPTELTRMLGGVDDTSFCQRFGIGYEELEQGGRAIVDGGGELGTILFAAGAGIADIRQIQSRIEAELQELFKSGGSNPRINKAIAELKAARDVFKEAQLPTSRWVDEDKALRTARKRQVDTDRELLDKKARKGRLERFTKALPLIVNRKHWLEQLATVAAVPLLAEDFTVDRRDAQSQLANAQQDEQEASAEISKLQSSIAGANVPEGLLERRSAISHLHSGLGSYQKAAKDRPVLVASKRQTDERAAEILRDLGREPDLTKADELRLTKLQRQRIQELATECKSRFDKHTTVEAANRKLVADIQATESLATSLTTARSADGLKQVIRQAQKHGDLDQQLSTAQSALRQLQAEAQVELKQLPLFGGTLDQLEQMSVCDAATIERFENEFKDASSAIIKIEERIEELNQKLQSLDGQLEAQRLAHDVPTEIDLTDARRQRDGGWQLIRAALVDGAGPVDPVAKEFVQLFASGTDLPQAFQVSIEKADVVADRLRHEADRVAEKASLTANRGERAEQLTREQENLANAKEHLLALQEQWKNQWTALNADPLPPREMRPWLRRQQSLTDKAQAIRAQAVVVAEKSALAESLRATVSMQLQLLDQAVPTNDSSLGALITSSESIISSTETANRKREDVEKKLADLKEKLVSVQEE